MNQRIEALARFVVMRACGFAALGIAVFMFGLSSESMHMATRGGAYLGLIVCAVLVLKAWTAERQDHKRTELWLLLRDGERPSERVAHHLISTALRDAYLEFATHVAIGSAALLALSLMLAAPSPASGL